MAEKIKIAELSINSDEVVKSLQDTKGAITDLTSAQKDLKDAGEENSKQFIKNESNLKSLKSEYGQQVKVLQATTNANVKMNLALEKEVKSLDGAAKNNKELRTIRNQINATTKEGAAAVEEINKKIDNNTDFIKKNSSALEKQKQNVGNYEGALKKARLGAIAFGTALKAAGIGLIVAGVAKLTEAFGRNQKIMNVVNTAFNAIGIVFDKVVGTIVDTVGAVRQATGGFDALGKVVGGLLTLAITPLKLSFYGIKLALNEAALAWENSFFGDKDPTTIKSLNLAIFETKVAIGEVASDAIEAGSNIKTNFAEAIGEVGSLGSAIGTAVGNIDFSNVIGDAKALTEARNNIEALIIAQEGLVAQSEREAEQLRQKRDDERNSIQERIAFSDQLAVKLEEQSKAEQALVALRLKNAQQEANLNKGNIELQNEVSRIRNEQAEVEARIEGQRSEQLAARNGLRNEELAILAEFNAKKLELEAQVQDQLLQKEIERQEAKVERDYENQLLELENLQINAEQKLELESLLLQNRNLALADIRRKDNLETLKEEEEYEKGRVALKMQTLDAIIGLAGAESGIGKAALVAKQVLLAKELILEAKKTLAFSGQAVARSTVAVAEGTAQTAKVGFPQNIPLLIGYAVQAAGIIGAIKQAVGASKSAPKAADGMLVGASHAEGGIHIEAEGGEAIINKRSSAMYRPLLSAINEVGGGKKFAQGGIVGSTSVGSNSSIIDYDAIAEAMSRMPPRPTFG